MSSSANKLSTKDHFLPEGDKELFDSVFVNFPDMIHSVNEEGIICYANHKASEVLGYRNNELIGMSVFDIYSDEIAPLVKKGFKQLKVDGSKNVRSKLKSKTGEIIDVEIRSASMYNNKNEFVRTYSIIRDLRELNTLKAQVKQSSKLASIGEFASGIMHDIKNPLSIITLNIDMVGMLIKKSKYDDVAPILDKLRNGADKIDKLCNRTTAFVRNEVENPIEFDLFTIIEETIFMVESKIKRSGATLINNLVEGEFIVECRPNQIEQVFMNLIGNACDEFTDQELNKKNIAITAKLEGEFVVISVKDTGAGIPKENQKHIFESFFTTKEKDKGTGLGLSVTNNIVREHGGSIGINSEVGHGAEFTVMLPKIFKAIK
jgi:PAS domain S-box-containing protein